jgi:hypothetical protein
MHHNVKLLPGRVLASISSRPGQNGRADGYVLEVCFNLLPERNHFDPDSSGLLSCFSRLRLLILIFVWLLPEWFTKLKSFISYKALCVVDPGCSSRFQQQQQKRRGEKQVKKMFGA